MSTHSKEKIVRRMEEVTDAVSDMNRAMQATPNQKVEAQTKLDEFKKKFPDAQYLTPTARIPTSGIKVPELEKQRDYLHEYVVGVFESQMVGQFLEFFKDGLPGDDYCRWRIPVNKTIGIPRHVAQHLSKNLSWKEMKPLRGSQEPQSFEADDMMTPFSNFETKRRGTFHPINAF